MLMLITLDVVIRTLFRILDVKLVKGELNPGTIFYLIQT